MEGFRRLPGIAVVTAALPSYDGESLDRLTPNRSVLSDPAGHARQREHTKEVEVPLSEHEQRMLKEIESALYADDPKFASSVRKTGATGVRRPTGLVLGLGILGLVLLVGGLALDFKPGGFPIISLLGFLVMFAAGVLVLRSSPSTSIPGTKKSGSPRARGGGGAATPSSNSGKSYSARMEDRFRRRFEQEP